MSSTRQTLSFLMRRFREAGIRPHSKFGQNFLIDLNLLDVLVEAAELTADDVVLEIGTGTGSLTALVAPRVAAVVTVEVDPVMFQLAGEELHALPNVTMLHCDALRNKNSIRLEVLQAVAKELAAAPERRFKLVANLPYNAATPIIGNLLGEERPPELIAVTIQKELADRLVAAPGTKDYGALSIWVQSQCRTEILRVLPPSVFWPRPQVHSAFIRIRPDAELRSRIPDRPFFHRFLRSLFTHRRKYLRAQLLHAAAGKLDKAAVDEILEHLQLNPSLRAEMLPPETMLELAETVRARIR
ncbi:MAG: ribosomal RNA small subunit methyltransferase A [Pirellulales bacterium]|nr:ribosomal RNA small subunit methyltransferase A [Pirellulales bacterium]